MPACGPAATENIGVSTRVATFEDRVRSWEAEYLWEPATPSYPADRREPEPDSPVRTPFQRDRDRIVHSKAFRRLKHKTQVFVAPEGDHYRTWLTHTLEACFISRTVARALALNEDLTEAIGSATTSAIHPSATSVRRCWMRPCASTGGAATTSIRSGWSSGWRAMGTGSI